MTASGQPLRADRRRALIVGAGLGGLSAAIHLRRAGFEVTVVESCDRVGGRAHRIEHNGFRFDAGPTLLNYPWVFEELFAATGREFSDYVRLLRVEPTVRFYWPDGVTLTLSSDLERLRSEFERLDPDAAVGLMKFLADAEAKYNLAFRKLVRSNEVRVVRWLGALSFGEMLRTSVWRSLNGELRRFFRSRYAREALGSYAMYLGGSPWSLPGLFSIIPYGEMAYGLWLPKGGMYALVEAIRRLAEELGVVIRTGAPVKSIRVRGGRVEGVELADGEREQWPIVVSNVDVPTTRTQLLSEPRRWRQKMTPGVVTFYWGLRGRVSGLGHHSIFLPARAREAFGDLLRRGKIPEDPAFYVSVASETDCSLAPPGASTVFVLTPTPDLAKLGDVSWPEVVSELRAKILARLRNQGVELDARDFVFEAVWTPMTWRDRFGLYHGSAFGAAHTLFQMGPWRFPNYDPEVRGLYYTGASTTPGTGVPMVVLSGEMTARRVVAHER